MKISPEIEDNHSNRVTPNPIPNLEVKTITSFVLVTDKLRSSDVVFHYFYKRCLCGCIMKSKLSKQEIQAKIREFFEDVENKTPKQVKKIKKLAMSKNISLKEKRKSFCKKCLVAFKNPKTRIRNKIKSVTCRNCRYISRWKLK